MTTNEMTQDIREIKFRAWDKTYKKMCSWDQILESPSSVQIFINKSFVFQQFIGFKDKNGKEIYEGDIIREDFNPHLNIWEVKYQPSYFTVKGKGYRFPLHSLKYPIEIIGNKFENPELMEKIK